MTAEQLGCSAPVKQIREDNFYLINLIKAAALTTFRRHLKSFFSIQLLPLPIVTHVSASRSLPWRFINLLTYLLYATAMSFSLSVHLFVCSYVCHLKRVLVGHWPDWPSNASAGSRERPERCWTSSDRIYVLYYRKNYEIYHLLAFLLHLTSNTGQILHYVAPTAQKFAPSKLLFINYY